MGGEVLNIFVISVYNTSLFARKIFSLNEGEINGQKRTLNGSITDAETVLNGLKRWLTAGASIGALRIKNDLWRRSSSVCPLY
jgi:hypothetical protein